MKGIVIFALGMSALSACAATPAPIAEAGYPAGSLALAAIDRGDWATAERLLTSDRRLGENDPARLVNLGRVYMATGRTGEALAVWRQALASPNPAEVETLGGRTARTDQLAREALDHYQRTLASR
jgi:tetratricopeptide (TPR) repeat protein